MTKLQYLRREIGLSQTEMAEACGLTRWAVHLIELGLRIPSEAERSALAITLGYEPEKIFPKPGESITQSDLHTTK